MERIPARPRPQLRLHARPRRSAMLATLALGAAAALAVVAPLAWPNRAAAGEPRIDRVERRVMRAHAGRAPRAHAMWDRLLALSADLDLDQRQQDRLRAIRRSAPGALMPKKQAVAEARLDLADLMARKDADAGDLRRAHERLVEARGALANASFDLRMQAREVLTQQQRDKLRENLRPRRGERRIERGPGGRRGEIVAPDPDVFGAHAPEAFELDAGGDAFDWVPAPEED